MEELKLKKANRKGIWVFTAVMGGWLSILHLVLAIVAPIPFPITNLSIGGGMLVLGTVMAVRQQDKNAGLRTKVEPVAATIVGVDKERVNRSLRFVYQLVCHWVDPKTGRLHVFRSEDLKEGTKETLDRILRNSWNTREIDEGPLSLQVMVYVDPDNPTKYLIDVDTVFVVPQKELDAVIRDQFTPPQLEAAPDGDMAWPTYETHNVPLSPWNKTK
ncbi:MAG: hypothetical protein FWD55_05170 [Propionibacteriaceae bacterium]|nr:hypothetical protein [Propionibacteriaceae bacterium]